jgi:hypothetical protein
VRNKKEREKVSFSDIFRLRWHIEAHDEKKKVKKFHFGMMMMRKGTQKRMERRKKTFPLLCD